MVFSAFRDLVHITGISYLSESDLGILVVDARDLESAYQCPRNQDGRIPASILEIWGGYALDSIRDLTGRLFALSFRVAVAAGLRWDDILNAAPSTTVLMKVGFPNQAPSFRSCASKMVNCLLFQAWRPDGHGVRPRRLKVATISALMTEVIKWDAIFSQLAIQ